MKNTYIFSEFFFILLIYVKKNKAGRSPPTHENYLYVFVIKTITKKC